ncbi:hypothetical protein [Bosea sp. ASV33]|uniref:hypothetical protein n=1 Tax=Bosea sp. ASV33 TaxID=2795106 RepID=UPI0018EC4D30|nr:hypothetical protein [Bosea sp. ASV33]
MRRVRKAVGTDAEWSDLTAVSQAGRRKLVEDFDKGEELRIDDRIYKKYMSYLIALFDEKCAYCETNITSNQPGDVEHYRPKGRVVDENLKPVPFTHPTRGAMDHPGYYWLAYDWDNLLPSCTDCNRRRFHGEDEGAAGKADRFPISGPRACAPGQEAGEEPLLIDPSVTDPAEHLKFLPDGRIAPLTKVGEVTLAVLGLNRREGLLKARHAAFLNARALLRQYCAAVVSASTEEQAEQRERINAAWEGKEPYTVMQQLGFQSVLNQMRSGGVYLTLPIPAQE